MNKKHPLLRGWLSAFGFGHSKKEKAETGRSMLVFSHTGEVITAQRALEKEGVVVAVKGPPPHLRTGCDMVIEFSAVEEPRILRLLERASLEPLSVVPVNGQLLEPVSLFNVTDYGDWIMVRAANMKITVEKKSRIIVNISGGGCPDVPYLASLLTGKTLEDAPNPKIYGQTLCGYALHLAFEEMGKLCRG